MIFSGICFAMANNRKKKNSKNQADMVLPNSLKVDVGNTIALWLVSTACPINQENK